ncbi:MAG: radical SAM protein [archaeon]
MRVSFLQNMGIDQFGVMYISAMLKGQGHKCEAFIDGVEKNFMDVVVKSKPDVIAISSSTSEHKWLRRTVATVKEQLDVPIIVGGPHATFYPDILEKDKNIDAICIGEGDEAAVEIFDRWESGKDATKVRNMWVRKDGKMHHNPVRKLNEDLDSLPFPDREIYYSKYKYMRNVSIKKFLAGRGCPYDCSYCHNHQEKDLYKGHGKYVRYRSVSNVIEEIKDVEKKYGMKRLTFSDDTFIINRKWLEEFLSEYKKEVGIPFNCNVRANLIDEDLVKKLKDANCVSVAMGTESGNEELRDRVLCKHITNAQILDSCRLFRKYGIKYKSFNMMCLPDETIEQGWDTVRLNAQMKADMATCLILQPYPRLAITNYAISKGYLPKNYNVEFLDELKHSYAVIDSPDKKLLENLSAFVMICAKHPSLIPFVRPLIKLPPNKLFKLFSNVTYAYYTLKMYELGMREVVEYALNSRYRTQ